MSVLQIAYSDFVRRCTNIQIAMSNGGTPVLPDSTMISIDTLFSGGSVIPWYNSRTELIDKLELTLALPSSESSRSLDYIAFRGLNLLFGAGSGDISIEVFASTDNFATSDAIQISETGIQASDLMGPFAEDLILPFPKGSGWNAARIEISWATPCIARLRKIYIGERFTFSGVSPFYPFETGFSISQSPFRGDSGSIYNSSRGRAAKRFAFNWRGISKADRIFYAEEILRYATDFPLFLYAPDESEHSPLDGHGLVFGWIEGAVTPLSWIYHNEASMIFYEDIIG